MKSSTIFWGVFLIVLGGLFLLMQWRGFDTDLGWVINLWPLLLVFWGISLLKISVTIKKVLTALNAIVLAFFVAALFSGSFHFFRDFRIFHHGRYVYDNRNFTGQHLTYNAPYRNISPATLEVNAGAGDMKIGGESSYMVEVDSYGFPNDINLQEDTVAKVYKINLEANIKHNFFHPRKNENSSTVKLNPNTIWDMDINTGAFAFNGDFTAYKTRNISLSTGASDVNLKIGDKYDTTTVNVEAGASSVEIQIPKGSACEIRSETGLSSTSFQGFTETGDKVHRTENYGKTNKLVLINISGGVSSFDVKRY